MLRFARASVGLAGFSGKILVALKKLFSFTIFLAASVPSRVRNLRKTQNFWTNFTDFEPEINIIKCKTEKLEYFEYFNARL